MVINSKTNKTFGHQFSHGLNAYLSTAAGKFVFLCLLSTLSVIIYWPNIDGGFVYDDSYLITRNPSVWMEEISAESISAAISGMRPVAKLTLALNHYLSLKIFCHPFVTPVYHLTNILVHVAAGIALFFFLSKTLALSNKGKEESAAFLPALLTLVWAVNPVHTQAVAYVVQRMTSMAALFFVVALLCYAKGREAKMFARTAGWFFCCLVSGLLAIGSKENAVLLPFFIVLYEWYFFRDLDKRWLGEVVLLAGGFAVAAGLCLFLFPEMVPDRLVPYGIIDKGYSIYGFTMAERLLTELRVVILYLSLIFFPHPGRLKFDYDMPISTSLLTPASTFFSLIVILLLLALALHLAKREKFLSFCLLWFFGNLLIESSFVPLDLVMEHRIYLPSMLFIPGFVYMLYRYMPRKAIVILSIILFVGINVLWTWQRVGDWRLKTTLYFDAVRKSPALGRPWLELAAFYAQQEKPREAVAMLVKAYGMENFANGNPPVVYWGVVEKFVDFDPIRNSPEFKQFIEYFGPKMRKNNIIEKKMD